MYILKVSFSQHATIFHLSWISFHDTVHIFLMSAVNNIILLL